MSGLPAAGISSMPVSTEHSRLRMSRPSCGILVQRIDTTAMRPKRPSREAVALLGLRHRRGRLDRPNELLLDLGSNQLFSSGSVMEVRGLATIVLWIVLLVPMDTRDGSCVLDQAQITAVPPDTFQALVSWRCGDKACWQRYVEVNGARRGVSFVCEADQGDVLTTPTGS